MKEDLHIKVRQVENLILEEFKNVPFHNLFMLNKMENMDLSLGGTCSDKVLHFKDILLQNNINAYLHSSLINGHDCHRMLSVILCDQKFYIDIGSGWPILKLIPENNSIEFEVLGIKFKTEILDSVINIYQKTRQEFKKTIVIPKSPKPEKEIMNAITSRFIDTSIYPFSKSIRYSILKEDAFYFLKENELRIFKIDGVTKKKLRRDEILIFLKNEFGGKIDPEVVEVISLFR